jgi:RNA polymerase sigma-70 factor (ECF subfamily)
LESNVVNPPEVGNRGLSSRLAQYRPQVQRHLMAMVRDPELADELTQQTYQHALVRLETLRDAQAGLAWLYRIATNVALDQLRRRTPALVPLDELAMGEAEAAASRDEPGMSQLGAALERSEMSECVQDYLETLPDDYRVAILLHDGHGLTNLEIADFVGCTLATVKIRVHRARMRLRAVLVAACEFGLDEDGVLVCDHLPTALGA